MPKESKALPDWEELLSSAARLQSIIPGAVLVGGTASAIHAAHRLSMDHDHVVGDLKAHYEQVLADLESVAGWRTARIAHPVMILGSLDGIETGIRQLIREAPLETESVVVQGVRLRVPKVAEALRIKAILILKRNATRDYLDFAALSDHLGLEPATEALVPFDRLYPQPNGESPLQQLLVQLAHPVPYDLDGISLSEYKALERRWHEWPEVCRVCAEQAMHAFDSIAAIEKHVPEPP